MSREVTGGGGPAGDILQPEPVFPRSPFPWGKLKGREKGRKTKGETRAEEETHKDKGRARAKIQRDGQRQT